MSDLTPEQWAAIERATQKLEAYLDSMDKAQEAQRKVITATETVNEAFKAELHSSLIKKRATA